MTWAFGKAILLGEHAVVYGHPALAGAIDCRVRAHVTPRPDSDHLRLSVPAWNLKISVASDAGAGPDTAGADNSGAGSQRVADALTALRDAVATEMTAGTPSSARAEVIRRLAGDIVVTTELPAAAGLGSSAALSVALTRALAAVAAPGREPLAADAVERLADRAERCFHDNPSGVDVALATRGGVGVFVRGQGLQVLDAAPLPLAVGLSGQDRRTADLVARVATRLAERPAATRAQLAQLGRAAEDGRVALERGDVDGLGALMSAAHRGLGALGVSTDVLDLLVAEALAAGACGAKLTGAGGGGAVIAATRDTAAAEAIVRAWSQRGFAGFTCHLGARA